MSTSDGGAEAGDRQLMFLAQQHFAAVAAAVFLAGLVAGWLLFTVLSGPSRTPGAPPTTTRPSQSAGQAAWRPQGAVPADLSHDWQRVWIQAVAEDYERTGDEDRAVAMLDGIPSETASSILAELEAASIGQGKDKFAELDRLVELQAQEASGSPTRPGAPADAVGDAEEQSPAAEPDAAGSESVRADSTPGRDLAALSRDVAVVALVAALAAAVALAAFWLQGKRREASGPSEAASSATRRAVGESAGGGPPWHPSRIDLGDRIVVAPIASDPRFYRTWLIHDRGGGLVGGAGLRSQHVGAVETIEIWLFRRSAEDDDVETPTVLLVPESAHGDAVFRARLGDQEAIAALAGARACLESGDLALDVEVVEVEAISDDGADAGVASADATTAATQAGGVEPTPADSERMPAFTLRLTPRWRESGSDDALDLG